jgi:hypothetical protein
VRGRDALANAVPIESLDTANESCFRNNPETFNPAQRNHQGVMNRLLDAGRER